jgi:DNA polymerase (family 10)
VARPRAKAPGERETPDIPALLREFGNYTALQGGNPYRAKAYSRAAESLSALTEPLQNVIRDDRLQEIPGVGAAIADIVATLHKTGTHPRLEKMRRAIPAGVLEMLNLPGLRSHKVLKLHRDLGISSLAELEEAARADRLKGVKGLGGALQAKILRSIALSREQAGRRHIHRAAALIENAIASLRRAQPDIARIEPAGELRRGCELVGPLDLAMEVPDEASAETFAAGDLTVHMAGRRHYGAALLFATGARGHLDGLQALAQKRGMVLDEKGLHKGQRLVAAASEDAIYQALGLPWIPPELREGQGEIERALAGQLPQLVGDDDIRGVLHAHTDSSDGVDTLEAMAQATRSRGYAYFGVADHSQSAHYAGGLKPDAIAAQHRAIDRLNRRFGKEFHIFKGIESDIRPDGALDYPDELLARFDFVVASVHGQFRMDKAAQTARIIRAVRNPYTTILGHMTGRQLLRRPGYEIEIEAVLQACAAQGVAVEINANPWRLDLDWRWHQRALELGCVMSINPDAHSTDEIGLMHWGVEMARKGGVPAGRVLNCLSLPKITAHFKARRRTKLAA